MTNQEIEQKVKELLSKKFDIEIAKIKSDSRLAQDLGVDSFGAVELMFELEETFGLKIADSDIDGIRSVNDIVVYLAAWLEKEKESPSAG
jgi:acyl carrier protein